MQSDSTLTQGVRRPVLGLALGTTVASALIAIAGVVTPLGLYEENDAASAHSATFAYSRDTSAFGLGTGPQGVYNFSRICSLGHGFAQGPSPCPYSGDRVIFSWDGEAWQWSFPDGGMTSDVPDIVRQIYSSGTIGKRTTVSNFFDIQWRALTLRSQKYVDNGTGYPVDLFRMVDSLVLTDAYKVVEGLVVDAHQGGVGFRNHTIPSGLATGSLGAEWSEDLLFIEPESVCVDTNLTLDFTTVSGNSNYTNGVKGLAIVDHGGFANLLLDEYPQYDHPNAQNNPDLWRRAYKAAVLNNVYTMFYLNLTNPYNQTTNTSAFRYRKSVVGQSFPLAGDGIEKYKALGLTNKFGQYLFGSSYGGGVKPNYTNVSPFFLVRPASRQARADSCSRSRSGSTRRISSASVSIASGSRVPPSRFLRRQSQSDGGG